MSWAGGGLSKRGGDWTCLLATPKDWFYTNFENSYFGKGPHHAPK